MSSSGPRDCRSRAALQSGFVVSWVRYGSAVLALLLVACSGTSLPGTSSARLAIEVVTDDAVIRVNERVVPEALAAQMDVAPGVWRVEVSASGYLTRRYEAAVDAGDIWSVTVELWPTVPEVDGEDADQGVGVLRDAAVNPASELVPSDAPTAP